MAHFLGLIRRVLWFAIGFSAVCVLALRMEVAHAGTCTSQVTDLAAWQTACDGHQAYCDGPNAASWNCNVSSCTLSGVPKPACGRISVTNPTTTRYEVAFTGACPTAGTPGPNYAGQYASDQPPSLSCSGPCKVNTNGLGLCVPQKDGTFYCTGETQYTGDACVAGPNLPNISNPPPETCTEESQINGECLTIQDGDSNPLQSPNSPEICIGVVCRPLNPEPYATAGCEHAPDSALCNGLPNAPSAPSPNNPPYPPSQAPDYSTDVSTQDGPVPIDVYGPADGRSAGPPDGEGNCPEGTTLQQGSCLCPINQSWDGQGCYDNEDPGGGEDGVCDANNPADPDCPQDGDREGEFGTCGEQPPACSGDEIDCAIMHQTWATRCALLGTEDAPGVDLSSDPLEEYGGVEALFSGTDSVGPGELDESGWLGGGSCPTMAPVSVLGQQITFTPVWCELTWLGTLIVALAYLIAVRIVYGD